MMDKSKHAPKDADDARKKQEVINLIRAMAPLFMWAEDSLMTEREAAAFLNCSEKLMQKMRATGDGPKFTRVASSVRYNPKDLRAYVRRNTRTSTSDQGRPKKR